MLVASWRERSSALSSTGTATPRMPRSPLVGMPRWRRACRTIPMDWTNSGVKDSATVTATPVS